MTIWEAFEQLKAGKAIRRSTWTNKSFRVELDGTGPVSIESSFTGKSQKIGEACFYSAEFTSDWELYEPPIETFDFAEAMKRVAVGKRVRQKSWGDSCNWYVKLSDDGTAVMYENCDEVVHDFVVNKKRLTATDWHEVPGGPEK